MNRFVLAFCFTLLISLAAGQNLSDVSYTIRVSLDDKEHQLHGSVEILFRNDTGKNLDSLCLLLSPNAYKDNSTAFASQRIRFGYTDFHFARPKERGGIDSLDFKWEDKSISFSYDSTHGDIGWIIPDEPLHPGEICRLETPFKVQIPESFSRLGRVGQSYQVTQWFPKLAMYDTDGWHPLPYLDIGEFYSEFASYDVTIDIPKNYIVAATGLLTAGWYDDSVLENQPSAIFPPTSDRRKEIRFTASGVHDFAWFADKRFAVRSEDVALSTGTTKAWAFYTSTSAAVWDSATTFLSDALKTLDKQVGSYPYPHMTAVEAPLSAGTGMEYPCQP